MAGRDAVDDGVTDVACEKGLRLFDASSNRWGVRSSTPSLPQHSTRMPSPALTTEAFPCLPATRGVAAA